MSDEPIRRMTGPIILCGPDGSGDLDAICTCGHTKREHLRDSCPCWYFEARTP